MREIKFRGKHKCILGQECEWIYGSYLNPRDSCAAHFIADREIPGLTEVIPTTVGQYIGLKDTTGIEIYEGDILEIQTKEYVYQAVVVYVSDLASFFVSDEQKEYISFTDVVFAVDDGGSITVIGNVFDNLELKKRFWEVWNQENNEKITNQ